MAGISFSRVISAFASLAFASAATFAGSAQANEFSNAWHNANSSIVLDAYEYTPIDWSKMRNNKRLVGFINKASDGMAPTSRCSGNPLCRVKWRRYAATRELYHTRRHLAKELGMKWGAYHLARPGNPVGQANHFLQFAKPDKDDLIALDIEHNDPKRWMSLKDAEIFARVIKQRTGRYPVLYTNHSTAKFIAAKRDQLPLLSRLNLWYARYKTSVPGVFPMGHWKSYTLWQFSSMVNCSDRSCPWRINGAGNWIDVNVAYLPPAELRRQWPFAKLQAVINPLPKPKKADPVLVSATKPVEKTKAVEKQAVVSTKAPVRATATTQRASLRPATQSYPTNMWVRYAPTPKFRPGSVIVKRVAAVRDVQIRASDAIVQLVMSVRPVPALVLPKDVDASSGSAVESRENRSRKRTGMFAVESVLFERGDTEVEVIGPVRNAGNSI